MNSVPATPVAVQPGQFDIPGLRVGHVSLGDTGVTALVAADNAGMTGAVVIEPPKLPEPGQPFDVKGFAYQWWVSILVGGNQVAGWLTGRMEIDREEGAAAVVAELPSAEPFVADVTDPETRSYLAQFQYVGGRVHIQSFKEIPYATH